MKKKEELSIKLETISEKIRHDFEKKDAARESLLKKSREIIRFSSKAIRALHRREKSEALQLIESAAALIREEQGKHGKTHRELLNANYFLDSCKEYAEAAISYGIVIENDVPDPDALGIPYHAYLNGLAESVGELRRYLLDSLRRNEPARAEDFLNAMDSIYSILVTMDFPDAITYGLRRNTDNVRGIVEKTRGELTITANNSYLLQKISILGDKLGTFADKI
ncbi:MAG: haloacid dehalogenase [Dehalococcoidia bacterium]|nr:haloacid dehalogenase [Dehalococcoidia bacterium]MDD5493070.1 haloacid dehalogenase [Dehalococcoidia bacterium]